MLSRYPLVRSLLLLVGIPVLMAALLFPVFGHARENARRSSCQSNLKQIMLGIKQYAQDYDNKYPLLVVEAPPKIPRESVFSGPTIGWADGMQPYTKSVCILQCPSEMNPAGVHSSSEEGGYTDYWMNAGLAGQKESKQMLIMFGDGEGNGNGHGKANYAVRGLPANWQNALGTKAWRGQIQPPWFKRHLNGANYAFTDGHVKWLRPEQIGTADWRFAP